VDPELISEDLLGILDEILVIKEAAEKPEHCEWARRSLRQARVRVTYGTRGLR
jgi:hypothetical protein